MEPLGHCQPNLWAIVKEITKTVSLPNFQHNDWRIVQSKNFRNFKGITKKKTNFLENLQRNPKVFAKENLRPAMK